MLFRWKLIPNEQYCLFCKESMKIKKSCRHADKFEWRCMNYNCQKYQTTLNIKQNSFFSSFKVDISIILEVIYYISKGLQNFEIMHVSIVKRDTLLRIRALINNRIKLFFDSNPIRLEGPGCIVQVDETKLNFNVKNHRGRSITACWALCIVDTSYRPALGFCTIVEDRSANILLDIISRVVVPGSIICTDEWSAYKALGTSLSYEHRTVCHKYNFVNPYDGTHTQHDSRIIIE
ncbi:hypothetical protein DMUE_1132 [Dictyocoela muelleri]|nr:hypothetical protein DMUE_1132 [Dictyocoela muelleri]